MSHAENDEGFGFTICKGPELKKLEKEFGKIIRVSRKDFKLVWCTFLKLDHREVVGLCDPASKTLYINVTCGDPVETLIHEIGHAEILFSGLRQRRDWCMNMEEQLVELFSQMIANSFSLRKK